MSEQNSAPQQRFRYWKEVEALAPKPGRDLGTLTYVYNGESVFLRVIEGAMRDSLTFLGLATTFSESRALFFHLKGSHMDLLEQLPYSPYDREATFSYDNFSITPAGFDFPFTKGKAIYTKIASMRDSDPDGALIQLTTTTGDKVDAFLSGIKRGWCPFATVVIVGIVVFGIIVVVDIASDVEIKGKVTAPGVSVDIEVNTKKGPSTAPITSGQ